MLHEESLRLINKFKELKKDGWTMVEIVVFIKACLCTLVLFASKIEGLNGVAKAKWVSDQFQELYWEINPDIPKIPNWIETIGEKIVIEYLTPALVILAYNSVFNKKEELENKI